MSFNSIKVNNSVVTNVDNSVVQNSSNLIKSGSTYSEIINSQYENYFIDGWIDGSNKFVLGYGNHFIVPLIPGKTITIDAGSDRIVAMYFLKTYTIPSSSNLQPDFSDESGFGGRVQVVQKVQTITIPSDAYYLAVSGIIHYNSSNCMPYSIKIDGQLIQQYAGLRYINEFNINL